MTIKQLMLSIIVAAFQKVKLISYLVVERCRPDGRVVEYGCEVGAACCQHETVRFEGLTCGQERRKIRNLLPWLHTSPSYTTAQLHMSPTMKYQILGHSFISQRAMLVVSYCGCVGVDQDCYIK